MNKPAKLSDIKDAIEIIMDESSSYLNVKTGEVVMITDEEMNSGPKTYNLVLVLTGFSGPTGHIEDALFEAGCNDALLSFRDNSPYLEFDRMAINIEEAILSAIKDVVSANIGARVLHVELEDSIIASEITGRISVPVKSPAKNVTGKHVL